MEEKKVLVNDENINVTQQEEANGIADVAVPGDGLAACC